jgi:putative addiction module component (TIGR02574 family)
MSEASGLFLAAHDCNTAQSFLPQEESVSATLRAIRQMGIDDRIRLVQAIWDEIAADQYPDLTDSQREELDRRLADDDVNPNEGIPWEVVKAEAQPRSRQ